MKNVIFLLIVMVACWKIFFSSSEVVLGPGIYAAQAPKQTKIDRPAPYVMDEFEITELAYFEIRAKVLGKENYSLGRESDLAPIDLALGWGPMSDESVLQHIDISQSSRYYRWQVESFPIPRRQIEIHSANMHLIPATSEIEKQINDARKGDIIELSGSLVNVNSTEDGWFWKTSLTRKDTGSGACELILVREFKVVSI